MDQEDQQLDLNAKNQLEQLIESNKFSLQLNIFDTFPLVLFLPSYQEMLCDVDKLAIILLTCSYLKQTLKVMLSGGYLKNTIMTNQILIPDIIGISGTEYLYKIKQISSELDNSLLVLTNIHHFYEVLFCKSELEQKSNNFKYLKGRYNATLYRNTLKYVPVFLKGNYVKNQFQDFCVIFVSFCPCKYVEQNLFCNKAKSEIEGDHLKTEQIAKLQQIQKKKFQQLQKQFNLQLQDDSQNESIQKQFENDLKNISLEFQQKDLPEFPQLSSLQLSNFFRNDVLQKDKVENAFEDPLTFFDSFQSKQNEQFIKDVEKQNQENINIQYQQLKSIIKQQYKKQDHFATESSEDESTDILYQKRTGNKARKAPLKTKSYSKDFKHNIIKQTLQMLQEAQEECVSKDDLINITESNIFICDLSNQEFVNYNKLKEDQTQLQFIQTTCQQFLNVYNHFDLKQACRNKNVSILENGEVSSNFNVTKKLIKVITGQNVDKICMDDLVIAHIIYMPYFSFRGIIQENIMLKQGTGFKYKAIDSQALCQLTATLLQPIDQFTNQITKKIYNYKANNQQGSNQIYFHQINNSIYTVGQTFQLRRYILKQLMQNINYRLNLKSDGLKIVIISNQVLCQNNYLLSNNFDMFNKTHFKKIFDYSKQCFKQTGAITDYNTKYYFPMFFDQCAKLFQVKTSLSNLNVLLEELFVQYLNTKDNLVNCAQFNERVHISPYGWACCMIHEDKEEIFDYNVYQTLIQNKISVSLSGFFFNQEKLENVIKQQIGYRIDGKIFLNDIEKNVNVLRNYGLLQNAVKQFEVSSETLKIQQVFIMDHYLIQNHFGRRLLEMQSGCYAQPLDQKLGDFIKVGKAEQITDVTVEFDQFDVIQWQSSQLNGI